MELKEIYLQSQSHRIISLDKTRGMLSHAYLLECADTFILDEFVMFIAQDIFCISSECPCGQCNSCLKVEHSNMVDLKIYPRDSKNVMVEDINEIVTDTYQRPMDSTQKVYVIRDFDKATIQAQNKILKTIEEPPVNVIFILTCSNIGHVLPTIKSRVKELIEPLLDIKVVEEYLQSKGIKNAQNISAMSAGKISTALKLASDETSNEIVKLVIETLSGLRSSADILKFSSKILSLKKNFPFFVDTMLLVIRDIIVVSTNANFINFKSYRKEIENLAGIYSIPVLANIKTKLCEIYNKLEFNCNMTAVVDKLLLDILEVKFLC